MPRKSLGTFRTTSITCLGDGRAKPYRFFSIEPNCGPEGRDRKTSHYFATLVEAENKKRDLDKGYARLGDLTVSEALDSYEAHKRDVDGARRFALHTLMYRLRGVTAGFEDAPVALLTGESAVEMFQGTKHVEGFIRRKLPRTGKPPAGDSVRNALANALTWGRWLIDEKLATVNPFEAVKFRKFEHRRRKGKKQLSADDLWKFMAACSQGWSQGGDEAAVACLVCCYAFFRAAEITNLQVRDFDAGGTVLTIREKEWEGGEWKPKEEDAAVTTIEVPEDLQEMLREQVKGRRPADWIFGVRGKDGKIRGHWRDWIRKSVARYCELAKVPVVTAHGLRGTVGTTVSERGTVAHEVQKMYRHASASMTFGGAYVKRGAQVAAKQAKMKAIRGGKR